MIILNKSFLRKQVLLFSKFILRVIQEIGRWQGGALNLSQAKPASKQLNLKGWAMQMGSNSAAARHSQNRFLNYERYMRKENYGSEA